MIAVFTFDLSDLQASTKNNQWIWYGRCKAEIGGGFSQLNSELSVTNISECDLVGRHVVANFSEQPAALELQQELSTAQKDGTIDAMIITYHPEDKGRSPPERVSWHNDWSAPVEVRTLSHVRYASLWQTQFNWSYKLPFRGVRRLATRGVKNSEL